MSFQLSMKFRWAARNFFCWASKSNFSPQKISTDSERVRCVISLFRSKKKIKVPSIKGFFEWTLFVTQKIFWEEDPGGGRNIFFFGWVGHWKSLAPPLCVILLYFFLPPFSSATHVRSSGGSVASTDAWDNGFPSLRTWRAHTKKFGRKRRRFPARYFTFFFFFYFTLSLSRLKWRPPPAVVAAGGLFHLFRPFHPKKNNFFPWDSHYFHWNIQKWWENWGLSEFFLSAHFYAFEPDTLADIPNIDIHQCCSTYFRFFFHPSPPGGTWWIPPISFHRRIPPNL